MSIAIKLKKEDYGKETKSNGIKVLEHHLSILVFD